MFGYVRVYRPDLHEDEYKRYRSIYCGLCKALGREVGQLSRLALTYDVTFLCLLLFSLLDEAAPAVEASCIAHPLRKHLTDQNHTVYEEAALFTAALVYFKARDNLQDREHLWLSKTVLHGLKKSVSRFCRGNVEVQECLVQAQEDLLQIERRSDVSPFESASKNVAFMTLLWEQLLINLKDAGLQWAGCYVGFEMELERRLRDFWADLMRWIYFLDACDDWADDRKEKAPNPFSFCQNEEELWQAALPIFYDLERRLDDAAGQLSFVRDARIIGNIMRAGLPLKRLEIRQKGGQDCGLAQDSGAFFENKI